jgi:hypothetical protein
MTVFGMAHGYPLFRHTIDPGLTSPQGLDTCRDLIARLAGGADSADVPFPLVPDSAQRLVWGVPFLDELDDVCRRAYEQVLDGWPGHLFTLFDVRQPRNRRLAHGEFFPGDKIEDLVDPMNAGRTGERLATGLVIPDDASAEAHDAFGELTQIMLTAALSQRLAEPLRRDAPSVDRFTSHDLLAAKPALLLDVQSVGAKEEEEFAGRLISFAGHYSLALLDEGTRRSGRG